MKTQAIVLIALLAVIGLTAEGQVASQHHATPTNDKTAQAGAAPPTLTAPPADTPKISELQQTQLDYFTLQLTMINMQANQVAAPWQAKRQALIAEMVKANPGYRWQEAQMPGQTSGLVKIQEKPVLAPPADKGVQGQPTAKPRDDAK